MNRQMWLFGLLTEITIVHYLNLGRCSLSKTEIHLSIQQHPLLARYNMMQGNNPLEQNKLSPNK